MNVGENTPAVLTLTAFLSLSGFFYYNLFTKWMCVLRTKKKKRNQDGELSWRIAPGRKPFRRWVVVLIHFRTAPGLSGFGAHFEMRIDVGVIDIFCIIHILFFLIFYDEEVKKNNSVKADTPANTTLNVTFLMCTTILDYLPISEYASFSICHVHHVYFTLLSLAIIVALFATKHPIDNPSNACQLFSVNCASTGAFFLLNRTWKCRHVEFLSHCDATTSFSLELILIRCLIIAFQHSIVSSLYGVQPWPSPIILFIVILFAIKCGYA